MNKLGLELKDTAHNTASELDALVDANHASIERGLRFLRAFQALCAEHRAGLDGCGCCGGPSLSWTDEDVSFDTVVIQAGDASKDAKFDLNIRHLSVHQTRWSTSIGVVLSADGVLRVSA